MRWLKLGKPSCKTLLQRLSTTYSPAQINQQISTIVGESQLTREARENFYAILLDLVDGSDMMRRAGMQREGALKIITALQRYPEYFDHRDWTAVAKPAEAAKYADATDSAP